MFDPANDTSYHTLSPADVNTADSQVNYKLHRMINCAPFVLLALRSWR